MNGMSEPVKPGEPPGSIHNVIVHDVIVHCQGASTIYGHPDSWLDGVTFENIKFFISSDPRRLTTRRERHEFSLCQESQAEEYRSELGEAGTTNGKAPFLSKTLTD